MTKQDLLTHLADVEGIDPVDAAETLNTNYAALAMALLRLVRQGLVARYLDPHTGSYWYQLTERGAARLDFLESNPTGDTYGP